MIKRTAIVLLVGLSFGLQASGLSLRNASYSIEVSSSGEITVTSRDGATATFSPDFKYYFDARAPKVSWERIPAMGKTDNINYRVVSWDKQQNALCS